MQYQQLTRQRGCVTRLYCVGKEGVTMEDAVTGAGQASPKAAT